MAAQFGNALKYTAKRAEKGGVQAPRSITLSTPIATVVVDIHRAIWQTNFQAKPFNSAATPFFEARLNMSFFVRAGLKTGTHEKWHVPPCFKKKGVDGLLKRFG